MQYQTVYELYLADYETDTRPSAVAPGRDDATHAWDDICEVLGGAVLLGLTSGQVIDLDHTVAGGYHQVLPTYIHAHWVPFCLCEAQQLLRRALK